MTSDVKEDVKDERKTNLKENKEPTASNNETPKGKVSCLLCRGFITYKNSDRTRGWAFLRNTIDAHIPKYRHTIKISCKGVLSLMVLSAKFHFKKIV